MEVCKEGKKRSGYCVQKNNECDRRIDNDQRNSFDGEKVERKARNSSNFPKKGMSPANAVILS